METGTAASGIDETKDDRTAQLSVVIASLSGRPYIDACLAALDQQQGAVCAEVIVADAVGPDVTSFIKSEYPDVRLIEFQERKSVPELRKAGILAASGDIIVITEDHCIPSDNWYRSLVDAHALCAGPAIGGAVDNGATQRTIDWAVYFCEYSNFMSEVPHGVVHDLPGPNVSYKRESLGTLSDVLRDGYTETFLHRRLEALGHDLWSDPSIIVWHKKHFTLRSFLDERFHYGRWYAGTRNEFISPARRLFYAVFSLLLPLLVGYRLTRRVLARRRHYGEFIKALPYILVFLTAWAAGELTGYVAGPNDSVLHLS